ncbi:portal protein [Enterobacter hormaechei]
MPHEAQNNKAFPLITTLGSGGAVVSRSGIGYLNNTSPLDPLSNTGDEFYLNAALPLDRLARYDVLETMARSPTIHAALTIHISHALSVDKKTSTCFNITPNDKADLETLARCEEVMADIGKMIDVGLPSWAMTMAIYGVAYLRPHCEHGKGITSIEHDFYTLPHHVREFYRGGELVGFTGDYLLAPDTNKRVLADPWDLVPMRVPFWIPDHKIRPVTLGNKQYSLLTPHASASLVETQNYGTSFLESAYEPWVNMQHALKALLANRFNSGKMDRLIALATNELDPANASRYTREVTQALKRSTDAVRRRAAQGQTVPTAVNHIIPVMSGGKGGITIDTQMVAADITAIEDIMFWVRQLGSAVGVDATMLGWADQMSGGLGEGGWIQTAIQAALRAEWIRKASTETILRLMDLHLAYKYGKVYPANERPYHVEYNSLNTAIQEQENRDRDSRVNFISLVVTILDAIQNNFHLAQSKTMMNYLFGEVLQIGQETIDAMMKEFEAAKPPANEQMGGGGGGGGFMESAPLEMPDLSEFGDLNVQDMSHEELVNLVKFALSPAQED